MLVKEFMGGPLFGRKVMNKGTRSTLNGFVDLFPVRFEIYLCTEQPKFDTSLVRHILLHCVVPVPAHIDIDKYTACTVKPDKIVYYPTTFSLNKWDEGMGLTMKLEKGSIRLWVAATPLRSLPSHSNKNSNGDSGSEERGSFKFGHIGADGGESPGRLMTSDITDLMGSPWRLLRNTQGLVAADLLGEQECVSLLVEYHSKHMIDDDEWPRQAVLQQWKRSLQVGDVVDAQDKNGTFYEAVITAVHPTNSDTDNKSSVARICWNKMGLPGVDVHFKGWGEKFDETILSEDVAKKMQVIPCTTSDFHLLYASSIQPLFTFCQPLFTKTTDWRRALRVADEIDYRITAGLSLDCEQVWMKVRVIEENAPAGRIAVQYSISEAQQTMDQFGCDRGKALFPSINAITTTTTVTMNTSDINGSSANENTDNDVLLCGTVAASSAGPGISSSADAVVLAASTAIDSAAASVVSDDTIMVTQWVDLQSEDICHLYTHKIKPRPSYWPYYSWVFAH